MEQKSIKETVEVLKVIHPLEHIQDGKQWLIKATETLKEKFSDDDATVTEKTKIFNTIATFIRAEESNPMNILKAIENWPEKKQKIIYAWLESQGQIKSAQKKVTQSFLK